MPLPDIVPKFVLGHRTDVKNNAYYISDEEVMYACAAGVIFQNVTDHAQKHLFLTEKACFLKQLTISPPKNYFAALIVTPKASSIHIYETASLQRQRSLLLPPDATTKTFQSIEFSFDERLVFAVTGDPDWMVLVYNWERGKIESSTKANLLTNPLQPVKEIVCSPVDTSTFLTYGQGIFRLMNMQETVWRQYGFQKADIYDITSCCFLTGDRIVCGTDDGLLLLIELADLKYTFEADLVTYINAKADKDEEFMPVYTSAMVLDRAKDLEQEEVKKERAVRALISLTKGFAYACENIVYFFEKISPHKYKKRNEYVIPDKDYREVQTVNIHTVTHLTVNKSQTSMIAITRKSQLFYVKLWGPEMEFAGRLPFSHFWHSIHHGRIGDLAVCLWKPIFMTCGTVDRTVRVWNYSTNALEMMKQYQEDIHSLSLHPTGLYAAIGFSDKLRFVSVLIDDLQVCRELPIRECPRSEFNPYGHLLAAVNRHTIQIYNIITFQNVANLRGHNNTITCLVWTPDDKKLISSGCDGAIYEWDSNTFKRIGEVVNKGINYWKIAVMANGKNIFAVGSDNLLKEFCKSNVVKTTNFGVQPLNHVILSRSNALMCVASAEGWIMMVKIPIEEPPEYVMTAVHAWEITHAKFTLDDRILITCSNSGTICVWNLHNLAPGQAISLDTDIYKFRYFKEILISKNDLEEKLSSIKDLTQRTYELEMEHAYQMRHTHTIYQEEIKNIHSIYHQALEELKAMIEIFEANHNTELNDINSDINVIRERHEAEMLELEAKYNAELIVEYDKLLELENDKETLMKSYLTKLGELQASKEKTIDELTRINESKLYNLNKMVEEAREEINKEVAEHLEVTGQIEDDTDLEIETLKAQCEKTLKAARESNMRLKGESGVLKKKIITCEKEKDVIQMEILGVKNDIDKFKQLIKHLEQEILDLKKEVGERDLRIQDKEKRIYDLKRKDQEYERYKFVLSCRIKELKNQIEPMDKEIKDRKEHIAEMEVELYDLQKVNLDLDNNLSTLREKLGIAYKSLHIKKNKFTNILQVIKTVKTNIFAASGHTQDNKKLKDSVKKLYLKYITDKEFEVGRKGDEDCIAELRRQNIYLEGIIQKLGIQIGALKHVDYGQGMVQIEANWKVMDEINKIRKKLKTMERKTHDVETLISIRLSRTYSPRTTHKLILKALKTDSEISEACKIKVEEAHTKAALMNEEVNLLIDRILVIEEELTARAGSKKKKKKGELLHFEVPSII